tara:strand:- start:51 stop:314 length:264 start_codon:yes stop_codon:yes gene_type:complete
MTPDEKFITAILTQAVEDSAYMGKRPRYLKHKMDAIDWILNKDSEHHWSFLDYCTMIGLSPSKIQNKVRMHLNPKLSKQQQSIMKGI